MDKSSIVKELKSIGKFSNFQSHKKGVLEKLLNEYKMNETVPIKFAKKQSIGDKCKDDVECRTKRCLDNECVSVPRIKSSVSKNKTNKTKALSKKIVSSYKKITPEICTELPNGKQLNPHQKIVAEFMRDTKRKGLVVVHKVGTGKTFTALVTAQCLLSKKPTSRAIVLTPKSVVEQFSNELEKLNLPANIDSRINIYPHVTWLKRFEEGVEDAKDAIIIVDEAHKFKGPVSIDKYGKEKSKLARLLSEAAKEANKIMLLTATPIENDISETINYVSFVTDKSPKQEYKRLKGLFKKKQKIIHDFRDYLKCNFSVYDQVQKEHFPRRVDHIVKLKMSKQYQDKYSAAEDKTLEDVDVQNLFFNKKTKNNPDLSKFHNGIRRAVNNISITSPKIIWTIDKIKEIVKNNGKVVLYSTWLKFGVDLVADKLKEAKIDFQIISGAVPKEERLAAVDRYNANKLRVMMITSAGAEGLDLKETSAVIILEPFWHQSRIDQVVGRGIRYKSHANLPEDKRVVDIYHLVLEKKSGYGKDTPTADELLMSMSKNKMDKIDQLMLQMKASSIENTKCP